VAMQGQMTGQPTYLHVPKLEYDGLDVWQGTEGENEAGRVLRIYHHKNHVYTEEAKADLDKYSREMGRIIQKVKGIEKALKSEGDGPQAQERNRQLVEMQARSEELTQLIEVAEQQLDTGEETVFEWALGECK
jgi:hypothetical protein